MKYNIPEQVEIFINENNSSQLSVWFFGKVAELEEQIKATFNVDDKENISLRCDDLISQIRLLENIINISQSFLISHDTMKFRQSVSRLLRDVQSMKLTLLPRKPFRFSREQPGISTLDLIAKEENLYRLNVESDLLTTSIGSRDVIQSCELSSNDVTISNLSDRVIFILPGQINNRDMNITNISNCFIYVLDNVGALRANRVNNSVLCFGSIGSSALFYFVKDTIFVSASRQIRIHDSENLIMSVWTKSSPVIERSKRILFVPFSLLTYEHSLPLNEKNKEQKKPEEKRGEKLSGESILSKLLLKAQFDPETMKSTHIWKDVRDFNWVKETPSPHWCALPEALHFLRANSLLDTQFKICDESQGCVKVCLDGEGHNVLSIATGEGVPFSLESISWDKQMTVPSFNVEDYWKEAVVESLPEPVVQPVEVAEKKREKEVETEREERGGRVRRGVEEALSAQYNEDVSASFQKDLEERREGAEAKREDPFIPIIPEQKKVQEKGVTVEKSVPAVVSAPPAEEEWPDEM